MNNDDEIASALFDEGVTLFNCESFFECHEVWETLWKHARGADRVALQGMIQCAAAMHHARRGNHRGARTLWNKAASKLSRLPDNYHGIALNGFRASMANFFDAPPDQWQSCAAPGIAKAAPV